MDTINTQTVSTFLMLTGGLMLSTCIALVFGTYLDKVPKQQIEERPYSPTST